VIEGVRLARGAELCDLENVRDGMRPVGSLPGPKGRDHTSESISKGSKDKGVHRARVVHPYEVPHTVGSKEGGSPREYFGQVSETGCVEDQSRLRLVCENNNTTRVEDGDSTIIF
jgi:hypothetical protein